MNNSELPEQCPKCHHRKFAGPVFKTGAKPCSSLPIGCLLLVEYLQYNCARCGYSVRTDCKDKAVAEFEDEDTDE